MELKNKIENSNFLEHQKNECQVNLKNLEEELSNLDNLNEKIKNETYQRQREMQQERSKMNEFTSKIHNLENIHK